MEKRTGFAPPAVGANALMVIFALLALCVFAVLSLTAAQAEARLSERAAQSVAEYYSADLQSEKQFAQLKQEETEPGDYGWDFRISENRQLQVRLRFDGIQWDVLQWQTVVTEEPEIHETLTLWDGK